MGNLFRVADAETGGLAGAIRGELASFGTRLTKGVSHLFKASQSIKALDNIIKEEVLNAVDRNLAEVLRSDLVKSLEPLLKDLGVDLKTLQKVVDGSAKIRR